MRKRIVFLALIISLVFALIACNGGRTDIDGNDIVYGDIASVSVDRSSVEKGFLLSEFDISKVYLIINYDPESDTGLQILQKKKESGITNEEELTCSVRMPASLDMVKAEDLEKLSIAGSKTVTLIYGKFEVSFVLTLIDDTEVGLYKVYFYDENDNLISDVQYVKEGGRANVPALDVRPGYDFVGWTEKGTNTIVTYDNIRRDMSFVATYVSSTKTIEFPIMYRYLENGIVMTEEAGDKLSSVTLKREQTIDNNYPEPKDIPGYTFFGWQESSTDPNVIYAVYDRDTYTITFIYRNFDSVQKRYSDSMVTHEIDYYPGQTSIVEPQDAYCDGISPANDYQFVGWYVLHDGIKKPVTFPYQMSMLSETCFYGDYVDINAGSEGLIYKSLGGSECAVSGYTGGNVVVIPEKATVGGKLCNVTTIDDGVFKNSAIIKYVVSSTNPYFSIKEDILYSKSYDILFAYPTGSNRTTINVPSGVREINSYAFFNAVNLGGINLPDSLVQIDDYSFSCCSGLQSITIPSNVTTIAEGAFRMSNGSALTSLVFGGAKIVEFGDEAFYGLEKLTTLSLPVSIRSIGDGAFYGMGSLSSINAGNNSNFTVYNGALYTSDYRTLIIYPAQYGDLTNPEFYLHENCSMISRGAFYHSLVSCITFSSACTLDAYSIVSPSLEAIRIASESFVINEDQMEEAFGGFIPAKIYVPESMQDEFSVYFDRTVPYQPTQWTGYEGFWNGFMFTITDYELTIIGYNGEDTDLNIDNIYKEVYDQNNVKKNIIVVAIAPYAFYGNNRITSVTIPITMKSIGEYAFYGCSSLKSVVLSSMSGANLKSIGDYAFANCSSLTNVSYNEDLQLTDFGRFVFEKTPFMDKSGGSDFLIVGGVLIKYTGTRADVTIPSDVVYIATDAFKDIGFVTSVSFNNDSVLQCIDEYAFQNCIGILEFQFPATLKRVADYAFYGCKYLFCVKYNCLKENISIGYYAYKDAGTYYIGSEAVYEMFTDSVRYSLSYTIDSASNNYDNVEGICFVEGTSKIDEIPRMFMGWYYDSFFRNVVTFPLYIEENTVLYARFEDTDYVSTGFTFSKNADGTYSVSGYDGRDSYVVVPDKYKDVSVTGILAGVFGENVMSIVLPSSISFIEEGALSNTSFYRSCSGDYVTYNEWLLGYKGNERVVNIPSGITKSINGVFKNNIVLEEVNFPDKFSVIVENMFYGCSSLKEINIIQSIKDIRENAFYNCSSLEKINIANGSVLENVSSGAFYGTKWYNSQTDDCIIFNNIFYRYSGNSSSLHVPEGIVFIAEGAFEGNILLRSITLPTTVTTIHKNAFKNSAITEVYIPSGSLLTKISSSAFYCCYNLNYIDFSHTTILNEIESYAFYKCSSLPDIVLPLSLASLGAYSFAYSGLKSVLFNGASRLSEIKEGAFAYCYYLNSFEFNAASSLGTIGDKAFLECISLASYVNKEAETHTIGAEAFYNCLSIKNFNINATKLSVIGVEAFTNVGRDIFNTSNQMDTIGNILLAYRGSDTLVTIPSNIVLIYNSAFEGNTHLTVVEFENGSKLRYLSNRAFYGCTNLVSINFPEGITFVGDEVMDGTAWYNEKLRTDEYIVIGKTLVRYNVMNTEEVPDGVFCAENITSINKGAFADRRVYNIVIGDGFETIKEGAFEGILPSTWTENGKICTGYTITIKTAKPPVSEYEEPFEYCDRIFFPDGSIKDTYRLNDQWSYQFINEEIVSILDTHTLSFSVDLSEGYPLQPEVVHALYSAKDIITIINAQKHFEFVGWYLDSDYFNAVQYPLVLSKDLVIYAKCVNFSVGSNPESFSLENVSVGGTDYYTIVGYNNADDKRVVFITEQAGKSIISVTGNLGYLRSDINYYYALSNIIEDGVYVYIEDTLTGANYFRPETGYFRADTQYYRARRITVGDSLIDTIIPKGIYKELGSGNVVSPNANEKYQRGIQYYEMTLMTECVLYIRNPDTESSEIFVPYDTSIYKNKSEYEFFRENDVIEEITFANNCTIEELGAFCFAGMTSLKKITLPKSIKRISPYAFSGCTAMQEIVFSSGISDLRIESHAFSGCISLDNLVVPDGISELADQAFIGCSGLKNIYASAKQPYELQQNALPFDINAGLQIFVRSSTRVTYDSAWSIYKEYFRDWEE